MTTDKETQTKKKRMTGTVVSTKMTDTAVVLVSRYYRHPKYGKYVKQQKRYKAHDKGNSTSVGDTVTIEETSPVSKDKRFIVIQ